MPMCLHLNNKKQLWHIFVFPLTSRKLPVNRRLIAWYWRRLPKIFGECITCSRVHNSNSKKCERNYSVTELERLVILRPVPKQRTYLYGFLLIIVTGHQALRWLWSQNDMSGRLGCWHIKIKYNDSMVLHKYGKHHVDDHSLSGCARPLIRLNQTGVHIWL